MNVIRETVPNCCGEHSCIGNHTECATPSVGPSHNTGVTNFLEDAWKLWYQVVLGGQSSQLKGRGLGIQAPQSLTVTGYLSANPLGS